MKYWQMKEPSDGADDPELPVEVIGEAPSYRVVWDHFCCVCQRVLGQVRDQEIERTWITAHPVDPMSGSHDSGYQTNRLQLFNGGDDVMGDCRVVLCPATRVLDLRLIAVPFKHHPVEVVPDQALFLPKPVAPPIGASVTVTEH